MTKDDILGFIDQAGACSSTRRAGAAGSGAAGRVPRSRRPPAIALEKMSVMRKKIAEHMVLSRRTSAHVHSVFEVNFARVAQIREAKKAEYEQAGAKLTYMSFIIKAVVDALRAVPVVNASIDGDNIVYHKDVNVGIAVALDWGLIVPVIKNADEKNLLGLSRAVADLAARARDQAAQAGRSAAAARSRSPTRACSARCSACRSSTSRRSRFSASATSRSAPVVIDDAIAIRPMAYLTLGYDHRVDRRRRRRRVHVAREATRSRTGIRA